MTEIYEATNGVEFVAASLENDPFDLVITDVLMPWMEGPSGVALCSKAEVMTPVLVITGLTSPRSSGHQVERPRQRERCCTSPSGSPSCAQPSPL
jgi:DNA-binding NtrC family response regulator